MIAARRANPFSERVQLSEAFVDTGRKAQLDQQAQLTNDFRYMNPGVMQQRTFVNIPDVPSLYAAAQQQIALDDGMAKRMIQGGDGRVEYWRSFNAAPTGQRKRAAIGAPAGPAVDMEVREGPALGARVGAAIDVKKKQVMNQILTVLVLGALLAGGVVLMSRSSGNA